MAQAPPPLLNLQDPNVAYLHPNDPVQAQGINVLDRFYCASRIIMVVTLALFALSIAFLALATAQKIPPLMPLYGFAAFLASFIFLGAVHCCQTKAALKYNLDPKVYENAKLERIPNPNQPPPGPPLLDVPPP